MDEKYLNTLLNKLKRGLALTVKESWDLYKYVNTLRELNKRVDN